MDGRFVPNFAFELTFMQTVKQLANIPLDCHLMVEEPERYIDRTAASGATSIAIHFEATRHVQRALQQIRDTGARSGIALNPATPIINLDYILDDIDMITDHDREPRFRRAKTDPGHAQKDQSVAHYSTPGDMTMSTFRSTET